MINVFPLRVVYILDVAFNLMRHKFLRSFAVAVAVVFPIQAIIWILEISIETNGPGQDVAARTILVVCILQFFSVGFTLSLVSNILSTSVGKTYCQQIFHNIYTVKNSPVKFTVAAYHCFVQLVFVVLLVGTRFLLGQVLTDSAANAITSMIFLVVSLLWVCATLWLGFAVPISTHEERDFSGVRKRTMEINKVHFFKLVGAYCCCVLMVCLLTIPSLSAIQNIIANNMAKSEVTQWALTNIVLTFVIACVAIAYSYILTVTYFNARIEFEGFDIDASIQQLEVSGS